MKFEIKNWYTGGIIFSIETDSWKLAVEAAIKAKANLRYADLSYADLSYADLRSANLRSANLRYADLRHADLSYADLSYADLRSANLRSANLSSANLRSANLRSANLRYADLRHADLRYAKNFDPHWFTPLRFLYDQPGKIRAYKLVDKNGVGPFNGGIKYEIGESVEVKDANTEESEQCAAGINVATLDWILQNYVPTYKVLIVEFEAKDIAAIPHGTDGKFRLHRCDVVGEKNIKKMLPKEKK